MANLRILNINAADSRTIKVRFSANLAQDIGQSNINITSEVVNIPNVSVQSVRISDDILIINTLPQTPNARYQVTFQSTNAVVFRSADEKSFLIEDGRSNTAKIIGAENDWNPTRNAFVSYLGGSQGIYDLSRETIIRSILNQTSDNINKTRADIRQAKSANYLEILVKDERKTRRFGPWDRLLQEGAFEVLRVGTGPTDETLIGKISYISFPSDPISLQKESVSSEELILGTGSGTYDDLVLTLNKYPVVKVNSILIKYSAGGTYSYDISSFGYKIKDPKYDSKFARTLITLGTNQVKLSDDVKDDSTFTLPGGNDTIIISYEFKSLGKVIDETSVEVVEVIQEV
ncbi:MAG: hypothetical protein ACFFG0_06110 [Candidatus Thorarchaeota archaeon]